MGYWDNKDINSASGSRGGLYLAANANFVVEVQRCQMIKKRNGDNCFIAELKVLQTDCEDEKMKPGSLPAFFVNMDGDWPDLSLGNVADFMRAGLACMAEMVGEDHDDIEDIEVSPDVADSITEEDNLLAGTIMGVYTFTKEGKTFTNHRWSIPDNLNDFVTD